MTEPTPEEIRRFIASCNLARHGWDRFQAGSRRSAARILAKMATERESTVFGSGAHDCASAERHCAELNNRI